MASVLSGKSQSLQDSVKEVVFAYLEDNIAKIDVDYYTEEKILELIKQDFRFRTLTSVPREENSKIMKYAQQALETYIQERLPEEEEGKEEEGVFRNATIHKRLFITTANHIQKAVERELNAMLLKFCPVLNAVPIAYKKVRYISKLAKIQYAPVLGIEVEIEVDFLLFVPNPKCRTTGVVTAKQKDVIDIIVCGVFNARIHVEADSPKKLYDSINIGDYVSFPIKRYSANKRLVQLEGVLDDQCKIITPDTKKQSSSEKKRKAAQDKQEEEEEEPKSKKQRRK